MDENYKLFRRTDDILFTDAIIKPYDTKVYNRHLMGIYMSPSDGSLALQDVENLTNINESWKRILRNVFNRPRMWVTDNGTTYMKMSYSRTINKETKTVDLYINPNGIFLEPYKPLVLFAVNGNNMVSWINECYYDGLTDIPIHVLYIDEVMITDPFYSILNNYLLELFYSDHSIQVRGSNIGKYSVIPKSKFKVVYCTMNGMEKYNSLKRGSFQLELTRSELDEFLKTIKIYD